MSRVTNLINVLLANFNNTVRIFLKLTPGGSTIELVEWRIIHERLEQLKKHEQVVDEVLRLLRRWIAETTNTLFE